MLERGSIFWRLLGALVVVGILVAAGFLVYRAGYDQGWVQSALVSGEGSQGAVPGYPYYPGFFRPHFGFFPGFPLFGIFFFGLFILFLLRWAFRPWGWGHHGHWHAHSHHEHDRPQGEPGSGAQPGEPGRSQG